MKCVKPNISARAPRDLTLLISAMILNSNCLTLLTGFLKELFEKVNLEKKSADDNKSMIDYPSCKELERGFLMAGLILWIITTYVMQIMNSKSSDMMIKLHP